MIVRPKLQLALTLFFVLAVYFQSIGNPFSRFDDPFIVSHYGINSTLSFYDVITPGSGFYYRPLVTLSYWLDSQLWGLDPTFMHLENIVVHLINVFLVFLIASRLDVSLEKTSLPLLSALLFGLHPINSESVNWIAGRTDAFAGMFVFFAVYCLLRAIQEQSILFAAIAITVSFVGTLAKETAIMFIPTAFLIINYWPVVPIDLSSFKTWRTRCLLIPIVVSICFVSSLFIYLYLKGHGNNAVSLIFEGNDNIPLRVFEALGFYIKKMFLPLPLNVAIVEVHSFYSIIGIIILFVLILTFKCIGIPGIFLASAVLFTFPALVVATTSIAWTPFGERYLYIPSAFAIIGCLELYHQFLVRQNAIKWFVPIVFIVIVLASIATIQRGVIWGNNFAMIEDIVAKSPNFGVARNEYGILLKESGRFVEAENQFRIAAEQNNQANVNRMIKLNLFSMRLLGKEPEEVRRIILSEIGNKSDGDVELLKLLNRYDENLLVESLPLDKKRKIVNNIIETNNSLYIKTRDPHYLYRSGQLALSIGNRQDAAIFFEKAWNYASPNAFYREPAKKLAEELIAK